MVAATPRAGGARWAGAVRMDLAAQVLGNAPGLGIFVGRPAEAGNGPLIEGFFPVVARGPAPDGTLFSDAAWTTAEAAAAEFFPRLEIVGWYVARRGNPAVLTDAERRTHERWFADGAQTALVVDVATGAAAEHGRRGGRIRVLAAGALAPPRRRAALPAPAPWRGVVACSLAGTLLGVLSWWAGTL